MIRIFLVVTFYMLNILLRTFFHQSRKSMRPCAQCVWCTPQQVIAQLTIIKKMVRGHQRSAAKQCTYSGRFALFFFLWFYSLLKLLTAVTSICSLHRTRHVTIQTMGQEATPLFAASDMASRVGSGDVTHNYYNLHIAQSVATQVLI